MKRSGTFHLVVIASWVVSGLSVAVIQPLHAADGINDSSAVDQARVEHGRRLFERVWQTGADDAKDDDGSGPLFNERSCVGCHSLGGIGGGGVNEKNVELLSVVVPADWQWTADELEHVLAMGLSDVGPGIPQLLGLERRAVQIHKDLRNGSIVLHSFGVDKHHAATRERLLGLKPTPERLRPQASASALPPLRRADGTDPVRTIHLGDVALQLSGRNSTAMFGAGLIDRIPDEALREIATEQAQAGKVSGRFIGRFGWRGQIAHLDEFVVGACDVELGLRVEARGPTKAAVTKAALAGGSKYPKEGAKPASFDVNRNDADDLTAFVASLPAPQQRSPADEKHAAAIAHGQELFASIGCAECHRPVVASVVGIYSDLLVHEMGPYLADLSGPAATGERPKPRKVEIEYNPNAYYGISIRAGTGYGSGRPRVSSLGEKFGERLQEWKTPPLWGVADSAPYLHDGRAATVDEAIRLHGGEAAETAGNYRYFPQSDRDDLLAFLATLIAPPGPRPSAP